MHLFDHQAKVFPGIGIGDWRRTIWHGVLPGYCILGNYFGRQPVWHRVPTWVATTARNQAFTLSVASLQIAIVVIRVGHFQSINLYCKIWTFK